MNHQPERGHRVRKISFRILLGISLVAVFAIALMKIFAEFFNEAINLNPGLPNVLILIATASGVLLWAFWLGLVARKWALGLIVLLVPVLGLVLYHPVFGGDAEILGWKPRFWRTKAALEKLDQPRDNNARSVADLQARTDFDFPQFLGAERDGKVNGVHLDSDWNANPPKLMWKQPIGEGWSGFAIVNGFAITQEQRDDEECVTCYDLATGQLIWVYSAKRRHEDLIKLGKVGPRATPTIDDGLVYTMGGTGILDCLNGNTGQLLWSKDIPAEVGITRDQMENGLGQSFAREDSTLDWGRSGSPLILEELVIVPAGGPKQDPDQKTATLIAFDKKTGQEVWRGGKRQIAYGSPSVALIHGMPQVLLVAESMAVGHDPKTGEELWSHERDGSSNSAANCSQATFLGGNRVLFSKGYNMGGEIVEIERVENDNRTWSWRAVSLKSDSRLLKTKLTNPIIDNGHAFCLSDGYLECTQLYGSNRSDPTQWLIRKWKQRGRFGNGQVLMIGDKLLVHSEGGELMLVAADPNEYRLLGSVKTISGICWNTIGFYQNRVLVRSDEEMACFELTLEPMEADFNSQTN